MVWQLLAPGAKYAEALVAALATDPLVLHVVQTAKLKGLYELDGASANVTSTLDVSGRDMDIHIVSKAKGKTTKMDLVVVGKTVYARVGRDPWKKVRRSDFEQDITDIVRGLQLIRNRHLPRLRRRRNDRQAQAPSPQGRPDRSCT